jgi:hypothetical protein
MSTTLTPALRDQHEQDVATVTKGIAASLEAHKALKRIRDDRTYLVSHSTFEEFCRETWDHGRNYVNKLIAAAEVVESLPAHLGTIVPNEATARAVAKFEPSVRVEVVERAVAHAKSEGRDKITARDVQEITEVTPIPKQTRRTPTPFSIESWTQQTRNLLEMRLEAVPATEQRAARTALAKIAGSFEATL